MEDVFLPNFCTVCVWNIMVAILVIMEDVFLHIQVCEQTLPYPHVAILVIMEDVFLPKEEKFSKFFEKSSQSLL